MRRDARREARQAQGMDDLTDHLFLDAIDAIVLAARVRVRGDPRARFAFFSRLLAVAREVPMSVASEGCGGCDSGHPSARRHRPAVWVAAVVSTSTDTPMQRI